MPDFLGGEEPALGLDTALWCWGLGVLEAVWRDGRESFGHDDRAARKGCSRAVVEEDQELSVADGLADTPGTAGLTRESRPPGGRTESLLGTARDPRRGRRRRYRIQLQIGWSRQVGDRRSGGGRDFAAPEVRPSRRERAGGESRGEGPTMSPWTSPRRKRADSPRKNAPREIVPRGSVPRKEGGRAAAATATVDEGVVGVAAPALILALHQAFAVLAAGGKALCRGARVVNKILRKVSPKNEGGGLGKN